MRKNKAALGAEALEVLAAKKHDAEFSERAARATVGILLRGITDEMDGACGRLGPYAEDCSEVCATLAAIESKLPELREELLPEWADKLQKRDAARKAWRDAGGEEA